MRRLILLEWWEQLYVQQSSLSEDPQLQGGHQYQVRKEGHAQYRERRQSCQLHSLVARLILVPLVVHFSLSLLFQKIKELAYLLDEVRDSWGVFLNFSLWVFWESLAHYH